MVLIKNECRGCSEPGYPCLGESCPNRHVERVYCDICGAEIYGEYTDEICDGCKEMSDNEDCADYIS